MTSTKQVGLGVDSFPRFLRRSRATVKGIYASATGTWTVIHGLPLVIGLVVARIIGGAEDQAVDLTSWSLLGLVIALMALRALILMGGLRLTFVLTFRVSSWIKVNVLRRVLDISTVRGTSHSNGDILNRLRDDTDEIGGLLEWTTDLIYRSVLLVIAVAILVSTDVVMVIPLVLLLGGLGASVYLKGRVAALHDEVRAEQGRIAASISDLLLGLRDVRISSTVEGRLLVLERQFANRRRIQVRYQLFAASMADLFRTTVMIGTAAVLLVVTTRIVTGNFSIGNLVLFLTYIAWLGEQMFFFGYILARLQSGRVSHDRLADLVTTPEALTAGPEATPPLKTLTVRGLTCSSHDGRVAPQPVDFAVNHGELVAVTGRVGSGKSTMIRSLLAQQPDVVGSVHWNNTEVAGDLKFFRVPQVSYAPQSPRFLRGTVRENLQLGCSDITDAELRRALAAVRLMASSAGFPDGLDTQIDSGGANQMSGGQRQRLGLARMLCHPAQLYVVDDGDSSIDTETARSIWQTLPTQWPGAWLVVSHNPDLLARADSVVEIEVAPGSDRTDARLDSKVPVGRVRA